MSQNNSKSDSGTTIEEEILTEEPPLFKAILLNDDYTSMDFVVSLLENVFKKSPSEAVKLMLQIHKGGQAVCGIYPKQIAEAKMELVHQRARTEGFPLKCVIEPE